SLGNLLKMKESLLIRKFTSKAVNTRHKSLQPHAMAYKRKTWAEKMKPDAQFKVEKTDKTFADIPEGSQMLVPTPSIVDAYIRNIPEGSATTLQQMRKDLAAEYHADYTCPITSGIFVRLVAE